MTNDDILLRRFGARWRDRFNLELLALARHYGSITWELDPRGWIAVVVRSFTLPPGLKRRRTRLMLHLPWTYPQTPPYGVFLSRDIDLGEHYYANYEIHMQVPGWAWLCLHFEKGWKATGDIWSGDNLMTILAATAAAITEMAAKSKKEDSDARARGTDPEVAVRADATAPVPGPRARAGGVPDRRRRTG